jgi:hypothetical protein
LRASIQDSNIPLQDGGYSQKLDQFDNVSWSCIAKIGTLEGDIFFEQNTQFLNFKKSARTSTKNQFGNKNHKTDLHQQH